MAETRPPVKTRKNHIVKIEKKKKKKKGPKKKRISNNQKFHSTSPLLPDRGYSASDNEEPLGKGNSRWQPTNCVHQLLLELPARVATIAK
jgi:hypothetical protein